jgi:hypothetical protein
MSLPNKSELAATTRWLVVVALTTCACTAEITGSDATPSGKSPDQMGADPETLPPIISEGGPLPTDRGGVADACKAKAGRLETGRTPLRRLTRTELDNSIRTLLQVDAAAATSVTPDEKMGPFYSNAIAPVGELAVEQYQELAVRVAVAAAPNMSKLAACDLATDAACPGRFVEAFGKKAYRRPLEAEEKNALLAVFEAGKAAGDATTGFKTVVETLLQSPFFLYHDDTFVSAGGTQHPSVAPLPLNPYALAARLSFFLLGSPPDDALTTAAEQGKLTVEEVAAHVKRLLASDLALETVGKFHRQWLGFDDLPSVDRDVAVYPTFSPELATAAYAETKAFTNYVLRQGDGKLSTLLTSNLAFPSGALFGVYGATQPAGYQPGTPVPLDATRRAGLLTQAAFLMKHAHPDQTSPVHRGILVRENLLCGRILPPPPDLVVTVPKVTPATTTRQRFAQHEADPVCGACHKDIDPLGLGFENYDAIGQYRTKDGLGDVDASGAFTNVRADLAGPFVGAVQMAQALAKSSEVADCVSRQWFRFALGRVESFDDACTVSSLQTSFDTSTGNVPQLLEAIATSEAFRNVRSSGENQ